MLPDAVHDSLSKCRRPFAVLSVVNAKLEDLTLASRTVVTALHDVPRGLRRASRGMKGATTATVQQAHPENGACRLLSLRVRELSDSIYYDGRSGEANVQK